RAALLHRTMDHRTLRGHHSRQSLPPVARGDLVGRTVPGVPDQHPDGHAARAVPWLRSEMEPVIDASPSATRVPLWPLALFRIAFGIMYLDMALQKAPWIQYGWLKGFIDKEIANPTFGWYAAFLKDVVLPNFAFFGFMTFVTEFALGLGLLLGALTRLAGLGGFLWQINIALGAFNVPGEWYWLWVLLTL